MLNTDFHMFYDLGLDTSGKLASCKLNNICGIHKNCRRKNCQMSPGFDIAYDYAEVSTKSESKSELLLLKKCFF